MQIKKLGVQKVKAVGAIFMLALAGGFLSPRLQQVDPPTRTSNNPFFDVPAQERPISYIYAPGLMGSEIIMGRYCPQFTASTGEKISWKVGGEVIGVPHSAVVFPEIDLRKKRSTLNPFTLFFDRVLRDIFPLAERFFGEKYGIVVEGDAALKETVANYNFNLTRANIAQRDDIKALRKTYAAHLRAYPQTDIVLYGDSRGSATVFNFIALDRPKQVKAAVLEGIFDTVPHALKHFLYTDKELRTEKRLDGLLCMVMRKYKKGAPAPYHYAERITDMPLLLVTSLNDWVVSAQCTISLYKRLKARGHRFVHLLVLSHVSHPGYMLDDATDRDLYESVVHAFYKRYSLAHNKDRAAKGQGAFALTQPATAELDALYQLPCCDECLRC